MSSGLSPKEELDKAHFSKTMDIMKKKKQKVSTIFFMNKVNRCNKLNLQNEEAKNKNKEKFGDGKSKADLQINSFKRKEKSPDDQIRVLHEAYQFLLKKHKLGEDPRSPHGLLAESDQSNKNTSKESEEVEEEREGADNDSDNDSAIVKEVFALERAVDSALDLTTPQPSASEQEMAGRFKRKPKSIRERFQSLKSPWKKATKIERKKSLKSSESSTKRALKKKSLKWTGLVSSTIYLFRL